MTKHKRLFHLIRSSIVMIILCLCFGAVLPATHAQNTDPVQQRAVGLEGVIPAPPPSTGATISVPANGQVFTAIPITVSGICPDGLLVKIFKNEVFAGSAQCIGGSYSIQIDLFSGTNDLVARVYDDLDQPGPDSNTVTVTFNDPTPTVGARISLTSNYAKRGANPGETLAWPIILSGGQGPYAVSVSWGDGTSEDLISRQFPGPFDITHVYKAPGVYNIIIKATDQNGNSAFLQLVGIANGPISQENQAADDSAVRIVYRLMWWPLVVGVIIIAAAFWLGGRHQLYKLRKRIEG